MQQNMQQIIASDSTTKTGTMTKKSSSSSSYWSELPAELLSIIACKLSSACDFIRFRSACKSWRSAADPVDIPPSPPLLLLPHNPSSAKRTFFSLTTRTSRTFRHLEELRGKTICGSSHGWLALNDHPPTITVSLWNPLTGAHIPLPPLTGPLNNQSALHYLPRRVFLSSKPDDRDCVAVASIGHYKGLAFCRPRDDEVAWTYLANVGLEAHPASVVFHEGTCLVFDRVGAGAVVDLAGCPTVSQRILRSPGHQDVPYPFYGFEPCFADGLFGVKTTTEIFMVVHRGFLNGFATSESPSSSLERVRFFKLDTRVLSWTEVDKIGNNLAVFLSLNHASVFDVGSVGSSRGCLENCIYFGTTHLCDHTMRHPRGGVLFTDIIGIVGGGSDRNREEEAAAIAIGSLGRDMYGSSLDNSTWFTPTF